MSSFMVKSEKGNLISFSKLLVPSCLFRPSFHLYCLLAFICFFLITVQETWNLYLETKTSLLCAFFSHPSLYFQYCDHCWWSILSSALSISTLPTHKIDQMSTIKEKKGHNSMFPLKKNRKLFFIRMSPLSTATPPPTHSQPP